MNWKKEWKTLVLVCSCFLLAFYLPVGNKRFDHAIIESFTLVKWYAREHVVFCLIPAFFIAGAIAVFIRQDSVIRYLGAKANKILAYGVASISGSILAVCSCTILPLFSGIYRMGAGIGPATAFLYAGPAINVLAIILTARILGIGLGIARAVAAIVFSIFIGLLMHLFFFKDDAKRTDAQIALPDSPTSHPLTHNALYFLSMVGILIFANWGKPLETSGIWCGIYNSKWIITSLFAALLGIFLITWFHVRWWKIILIFIPTLIAGLLYGSTNPMIPFGVAVIVFSIITSFDKGETGEWFLSSWDFAKQIAPLLFIGVIIAGFLLGTPDGEGIIPSGWVHKAVGGNSIRANLFASIAGAFMYFATLTEVPILQGLISNGMGKGPALALLLAGPALSLPNMLVIRSVIGIQKTVVFVSLVIVMATVSGIMYGIFF